MRTAIVLGVLFFFGFVGIWFFVNNEKPNVLPTDKTGMTTLIDSLLKSSESEKSVVAPVPAPRLERRHSEIGNIQISDGDFSELSKGWKRGVIALATGTKCRGYDYDIWEAVGGDRLKYLLIKAQMLVESNCKANAFGGGTDYGLLQVQKPVCIKDVGVTGDLFDPQTNIRCAVGYLRLLRELYGRNELAELYTAYNAGPTGALRIKNPKAFPYVRKIAFAFEQLLKQERANAKV